MDMEVYLNYFCLSSGDCCFDSERLIVLLSKPTYLEIVKFKTILH